MVAKAGLAPSGHVVDDDHGCAATYNFDASCGPGGPGPCRWLLPRRLRPAPGWPPDRIYFMVCMACHEADGRGAIARKTMKDAEQIPDLTDAKWQASRTDAELEHSILEGKGKIMLAQEGHAGPGPHGREGHGRSHAEFPEREAGRHGDRGNSTSPGTTGPGCRRSKSRCTGSVGHLGHSGGGGSSADSPVVSGASPPTLRKPNHGRAGPCSNIAATGIDQPGASGRARFRPVHTCFSVSRPGDGYRRTVAKHDWPSNLIAGSATRLHCDVARAG